jgi:2-dehydro-3-deoxyglucarate aldolase/4-hydroxy-2-oxoheptanedioate aldolase
LRRRRAEPGGVEPMRTRLAAREQLIAAWLDLGCPASAELAAGSGFDAVIVDLEHGAGDEAAARAQIVAAGGPVLVRAPDGGTQAGRMLDAGAAGVIFPRIGSADGAAAAAHAIRYAGGRGVSPFARSNRWGAGGGEWRAAADAGVACLIQVERASALDEAEAIAALDDVDALYMGPADLSNDLGLPADLRDPRLRDAAARIARAATDAGKAAAIHLPDASLAAEVRALGFSLLTCSFESQLLRVACEQTAAALRAA